MNFPKTAGQCKYMLALRSSKPIVIGTGPAGSGKTLLACHMAIEHIARGKVILTRPIVAADEELGYIPGDMDQKMEPWTRPMFDIFEKYLTHNQMDRCILVEPLGFMRGRTFENTLIIADEMQNATHNQMKMLLTRIGNGTKLIITGDLQQSDLGEENGLADLVYRLGLYDATFVEHVDMGEDDIIRHGAVAEVLKILQK